MEIIPAKAHERIVNIEHNENYVNNLLHKEEGDKNPAT